jgi:acyl-coenzyme A synthetase/AMP-(fatty) acid ligase
MKTPLPPDLRARLMPGGAGVLRARNDSVDFEMLATGNPLSVELLSLDGARVLLKTRSQFAAALSLVALDGIAGRIVIAPPDLNEDYLGEVIQRAEIDTLVTDGEGIEGLRTVAISRPSKRGARMAPTRISEWVMFTSGTLGAPKMVAHTLEALTGAIRPAQGPAVWGTFYDIRRYGGLQIFLRAVLGDASLIVSDADEPVADFLNRLGRDGVTHLTGTPSHWRRALMSPMMDRIAPRYVRLSGEIADQAVLDSLAARFPGAAIGHAYASTEAGVGFEVTDGREGFPAALIGGSGPVEMRVVDGCLQIRSPRTASRYVGSSDKLDEDGFVDTGDMVELRRSVDRAGVRASESDQHKARYNFTGRRGGIINVGGLKLHPEEIEAVINRHPAVRLSRVSGRRNPITGAIAVAEVVLDGSWDHDEIREEILRDCRASLKPFQVPAMVRIVPALELSAGGKLLRHA